MHGCRICGLDESEDRCGCRPDTMRVPTPVHWPIAQFVDTKTVLLATSDGGEVAVSDLDLRNMTRD